MAKARFKAEPVGARRAAGQMRRATRRMGPAMVEEMDRLAGRTTRIMQGVAPRGETGRLAENIHPDIVPGGFQVVSDVRSERGYSYTGVTRFGHRVAYIYPKRAKALRFTIGGRVIFARRVRGYKPSRDWATVGFPDVQRETSRSANRIGRRIISAI